MTCHLVHPPIGVDTRSQELHDPLAQLDNLILCIEKFSDIGDVGPTVVRLQVAGSRRETLPRHFRRDTI